MRFFFFFFLIHSFTALACTLKNLTGKGDPRLQIMVENEMARKGSKMSYGEDKNEYGLYKEKKELVLKKDQRIISSISYPTTEAKLRKLLRNIPSCK